MFFRMKHREKQIIVINSITNVIFLVCQICSSYNVAAMRIYHLEESIFD